MLTIGLTGGVGSGKSTVCETFRELGITIISADVIAHELLRMGTDESRKIIKKFGRVITDNNTAINRKALSTLVFNDPEKKEWLEALLHPIIRQRMVAAIQTAQSDYVILDIPLLFETAPNPLLHRIIVVDAPEPEQIRRVMQRDGLDKAEIKQIMESQVSRQHRLHHADDVIHNDKGFPELKIQVKRLHVYYLQLAKQEKTQND